MRWLVYIVICRDDTLYTGITNDLPRRLRAHDAGAGARYTRGRGPVRLLHCERFASKGAALRREAALKRLPAPRKRALARLTATAARLARTVG
ncbi:MAG TPA: GIY-YIG nuclease family protein [Polyangia bacterium]|nr:GIY-YIG nuclease family protein [Polyangia bacterium]